MSQPAAGSTAPAPLAAARVGDSCYPRSPAPHSNSQCQSSGAWGWWGNSAADSRLDIRGNSGGSAPDTLERPPDNPDQGPGTLEWGPGNLGWEPGIPGQVPGILDWAPGMPGPEPGSQRSHSCNQCWRRHIHNLILPSGQLDWGEEGSCCWGLRGHIPAGVWIADSRRRSSCWGCSYHRSCACTLLGRGPHPLVRSCCRDICPFGRPSYPCHNSHRDLLGRTYRGLPSRHLCRNRHAMNLRHILLLEKSRACRQPREGKACLPHGPGARSTRAPRGQSGTQGL